MTGVSSTGRRILVIEDEEAIAQAVAARLRSEHYTVEVALDGVSGIEASRRFHPELVVLDLMLPGIDGLEVCKQIQSDRPVPVLMLTARDSETDLLVGLAVGADDYLTKPFSARELTARVHALLRRVDRAAEAGSGGPLCIADIEIDLPTRRVEREGAEVHLTPTEFDLLVHLATRRGAVVTRERLLTEVWGYRDGSGARTVDSHVRAIRRKLGDDVIRTVHGVGYAATTGADATAETGSAA